MSSCLTTAIVTDVFTEEMKRHGGRVTDVYDDGTRLFARSVLSLVEEVRPRDRVQGGVAVKATSHEISVHPYVFREVCRNGAIMAHSLQSRRLVHLEEETEEEVILELRETIAACCMKEPFATSVHDIRNSLTDDIDLALMMLPLLSRSQEYFPTQLVSQILDRFLGEKDSSRFGLMNAITSVARDTSDPDWRWRLEELGGGVAARIGPLLPVDSDGAMAVRRRPIAVC